jgi:hypothetical protein
MPGCLIAAICQLRNAAHLYPRDGEVTVVTDETMGEKNPLLAKLLAAATAGGEPAGPASKRRPIRIVLKPEETPVGKGVLCEQTQGFNLQAATRVAANDKPGRERLCRHILRPPLANDRLSILFYRSGSWKCCLLHKPLYKPLAPIPGR